MEAQTDNAFQILDEQDFYGCNIPKQCKFRTFSICIADNIDLNGELICFWHYPQEATISRTNHSLNKKVEIMFWKKKNISTKIKISFIKVSFLFHGRILKFFSTLKEFSYLTERQCFTYPSTSLYYILKVVSKYNSTSEKPVGRNWYWFTQSLAQLY